jgi:nucleoside-triphosphatase
MTREKSPWIVLSPNRRFASGICGFPGRSRIILRSFLFFYTICGYNVLIGVGSARGRMGTMGNILLTGRPGIGKTTVVRKLLKMIEIPAGGFYTEEIRPGESRQGFRVVDLAGPTGLLAHVDRSRVSGSGPVPRVGKYHIDLSQFETVGVQALERAIETADLIVADEIGRMELFSASFQRAILRALDSPKMLLAVIQRRSDPLLDGIRSRSDVRLFTVTAENRDHLAEDLFSLLSRTS